MATLTMQPIGPTPASAAQEDQRKGENSPTADGTELSDIGSGWVILNLKSSDIVSADLAAAAAVSGGHGGFSEVWCTRSCHSTTELGISKTVGFVENAVEAVEHIAEVTQKLAANVAQQLPEDGSLQKAVEEVEHIAEVVDDDAEKLEAIAEKIDKVSDEIDAAVEPVIEELEKELGQSTTSDNGANTKNSSTSC